MGIQSRQLISPHPKGNLLLQMVFIDKPQKQGGHIIISFQRHRVMAAASVSDPLETVLQQFFVVLLLMQLQAGIHRRQHRTAAVAPFLLLRLLWHAALIENTVLGPAQISVHNILKLFQRLSQLLHGFGLSADDCRKGGAAGAGENLLGVFQRPGG